MTANEQKAGARRQIGSDEIGLNPNSGREKDLFRWFLASFLFGKRIRQETARKTYEVLIEEGIDTPDDIIKTGWMSLVHKLDKGGYTRYDESTASMLIADSHMLKDKYEGKVRNIFAAASSRKDLEDRLDEFKGVGPKTIEIFLRDIEQPMSIARGARSRRRAA